MDKNKDKKLSNINYKIQPTCYLCKYSNFHKNTDWGVCKAHQYAHLKHTESERSLSIHKTGYCPGFEVNKETLVQLHGFSNYFEYDKKGPIV